jgi:DNA repair protein RecN (Recombination protein N)
VKNLALITETEVHFREGLNILSGETGAGKSIIIGSVNLALGAKADKDIIRNGAEYALVELVFQVEDAQTLAALKALEVLVEEDGLVIIQRRIQPNRSTFKICGETAVAKQVKAVSELLIDIHGQHENQSLLYTKNHMEILDSFAGSALLQVKEALREEYGAYLQIKQELGGLNTDEGERAKELGLAEFEYNEIEEAALTQGEDEELENLFKKMSNSRQIVEAAGRAYQFTGNGDQSAADLVGHAVRDLRSIEGYDGKAKELADELENIDALLNDFNRGIAEYMADMEFDAQAFADTQERLNTLNHLKLKYGGSIESIFEYQTELAEKIEKLKNADAYKAQLEEQLAKKQAALEKLCAEASEMRTKEAKRLAEEMTDALTDLNFLDVQYEIQVRGQQELSASGYDDVEFMISTNPGEPLKSLGSVASGGELSRIMLALKTVLASRDKIPTMIFDEIDAGISGKTAWKVSEKLGRISRNHQVICITHLPQIAAMADTHFMIAKQVIDNTTVTDIHEMSESQAVDELARMLGSDELTDTVRENARELMRNAKEKKQGFV